MARDHARRSTRMRDELSRDRPTPMNLADREHLRGHTMTIPPSSSPRPDGNRRVIVRAAFSSVDHFLSRRAAGRGRLLLPRGRQSSSRPVQSAIEDRSSVASAAGGTAPSSASAAQGLLFTGGGGGGWGGASAGAVVLLVGFFWTGRRAGSILFAVLKAMKTSAAGNCATMPPTQARPVVCAATRDAGTGSGSAARRWRGTNMIDPASPGGRPRRGKSR